MIFLILLMMLLGPIDGPPPEPMHGVDENGMSWEASPGLLPVTVAAHVGDAMGQSDYLTFLSPDYWPCNINSSSNNTSLFMNLSA